MADLSPAAQAIINAAVVAGGGYGRATPVLHARLAAALRAAASQWRNEIREQPNTEFICGIKNCIDALDDIAAELEGHD